ncbi:MAG: hypothetical protein J2P50_03675 [Hyphomicrobiaceae bacterium]|nr:hypothetical protein [Hyphomicrobiaceae bacterium]
MSRCAAVLGILLGTMGFAHADDETGVAVIHTWVKVGRKTCMADHYHSGNGDGATRLLATRHAIQSWADFTAWEYGSSWGHYWLAISKKMTCERTGSWSCFLEARPCRRY